MNETVSVAETVQYKVKLSSSLKFLHHPDWSIYKSRNQIIQIPM